MEKLSLVIRMRFVKQSIDIPVGNLDEISSGNSALKVKRHSELLPNNVRCIIAGSSGTGKTNLLISLIESEHGLKFENLYLYSQTLDQDKYKYLCKILRSIGGIGCYTFNATQDIITPTQMKKNSLVVFDDVITVSAINKTIVRDIFTLGRHRCIDVVYIVQSYTKLDKHLVRDNCNFIILFKQDELNLKHVFSDFGISADMTFEQFHELCHECWRESFGFVCISMEHELKAGRYRKNFNKYLTGV